VTEEEEQVMEEVPEEAAQDAIEPEQAEEAASEEAAVEEDALAEESAEVTALRQELEATQAKEAEYLDGWQRARAELANARKRFQREQEQAYVNAKSSLLVRLLPVVDDFERALETLPGDPSTAAPEAQTWIEGVKLIQHKLQVFLEQEGVAPIEAVSKEFDPFLHQAITHEPTEDVPEGHVIAEMQKGYLVGERVLRPSVVRVSAGPAPEPEAEPETEAESAGEENAEE
jgi:molecular chaperone GrpE